eukprot:TRINITY_DN1018_c0_g1_i6.p1 TRINITY_DN1018_c0_g1~~TRINITY_DN1018_c0_g1_i6.p1  ORF type:complete len:237 (-),score=69.68 TRINITY_DN1018_c0_g1_i6:305-1015(-)
MTDEGNKGDNDTKLVWADEEESDEEDNMLKVSNDMQNAWGKIEEEPKEKEETEKEEKAEETVEKTGPEDTSGDNTQRNDSRRSPDGDRRGGDSKFFEPKLRAPPRVSNPLPDSPPYRAYVGNIKHAATQDDVGNYFDDEGCGVEEVIILTSGPDNKPKGSAFVIFKELEGLKKALDLDGNLFMGRDVKVSVANPRVERRSRRDDYNKGRDDHHNRRDDHKRDYGRTDRFEKKTQNQ